MSDSNPPIAGTSPVNEKAVQETLALVSTSPPTPGRYTAPGILPTVSGYDLLDEVGRGGMGVVYRAHDRKLDRDVAVKLLQDDLTSGGSAVRRFHDEARITAQLQHPGIPPVHEVGTLGDGRPFLSMKLIKGCTFDDMLRQRNNQADDHGRFLAIFETVCQAVGYAHAHGVIHRDLKPGNVMVGAFGEVQVMDWGLAKILKSGQVEPNHPDFDIRTTTTGTRIHTDDTDDTTRAGSVLGTPAFMSPEQAIGAWEHVDARSDVFSLGAILCVILTGQLPYLGSDSESTRQLAARAQLDEAFIRLDCCGAEPVLVDLCKQCLSPQKDLRPQDAGAVAAAVASYREAADERARQAEVDRVRAESERVRAQAEAREQRKLRRIQLALAGAVGLLIVGTTAVAWQMARQAEERVTERDQAIRQQRALVQEFARFLATNQNLSRQKRKELVVQFLTSHPEFNEEEFRTVFQTDPHSFTLATEAGTQPSSSFNPTMFGD